MVTTLARRLPILDWGRRYDRRALVNDGVAAVIVTIMLIPQSLAYAMLAGLPAEVGLYASILPLVAYAVFGTSRALAVGPVAVVSLMTATAVGDLAATGADPHTAALVLALLSGLFLMLLGVLRLGFLANFLSHPVISGFITAAALIIAASQLQHLLGVPAAGHDLPRLLLSLAASLPATDLWTLAIGAGTLAFLLGVRTRLRPLLHRLGLGRRLADVVVKAGPVAAVAATTLVTWGFGLHRDDGVAVVGEVPRGLPPLTLPSVDLELWGELLLPAVLIAVVGFVESVSVAQTLAAKKRQRVDPDQELVGLGAANVAASVSGGYPVTGGFARSVVNFDAGAETPAAGAFTALGIAVVALALTPLLVFLPKATLAATIIVAVLSLIDLGALRRTWRYAKSDFAAMAGTILVTLGFGVETGIAVGVGLSLLLFLWRTSRPHLAVVGQVPGSEHFRNVLRHDVVTSATVLSVRVDESLYFANARHLEDRIYDLAAARPEVTDVVLMCPAVNFIDASALESLEALVHRLADAGVRFHLSEVKGPVMDRLERVHFLDHLTGEVFLSQHQAMAALDPATLERARPPAAAGG